MSESNGTAVLEAPEVEEAVATEEQPQEVVAEVKTEQKPTSDSEWKDRYVNETREAERAVALAESEVESAKEELKLKKAQFDWCVSKLRSVVSKGPDPQPSLFHEPTSTTVAAPIADWRDTSTKDLDLSNHAKKAIALFQEDNPLLLSAGDLADWLKDAEDFKAEVYFTKPILEELADILTALQPPAPEVTDESWRDTSIEEIGISGGLMVALQEAGLSTVGKIADYTSAGKLLQDIKHVGPASVEKIEKAMEVFWASRAK